MSTNYLKNFAEGETIRASETNANNQFLLNKISDNASDIQLTVQTQISNVKSELATFKQNLQQEIDKIKENIFVVEKGGDASNWFRIYSDGWIEQGGISSAVQGQASIVLAKSYSNVDYTIVTNPIGNQSNGAYNNGVRNITENGFTAVWNGEHSNPSKISWVTYGY
jgi:hypothetical protein